MTNGTEFYILKGVNQQNFTGLKDKQLRFVFNSGGNQYLFCSKDYDRDFDIKQTNDSNYQTSIPRYIEPGMFEVQDACLVNLNDSKHGHLKSLIRVGDNIYMDTVDNNLGFPHEGRSFEPKNSLISTCVDKFYFAYSFNWPYFSIASKDNFIYIFNAFNKDFIQRFKLPERVTIVCSTFLTDTHDFYAVVETIDEFFEIYHINLDSRNPDLNAGLQAPIHSFCFQKVGYKQIDGYHVRGSSSKEKINLNKQLMLFFKLKTELWGWNSLSFKMISDKAHNMYYLSDDVFFFMETTEIKVG